MDPTTSASFPWAALAQTLGILVGAGLTLYQVLRTITPTASRVKHDLEILKLAKEAQLDVASLEERLRGELGSLGRLGRVPSSKEVVWSPEVWGTLVLAVVVFLGFGAWTIYLIRDGFTWWSVLTGMFAFGGITPFGDALQRHEKSVVSMKALAEGPDVIRSELSTLRTDAQRLAESCDRLLLAIGDVDDFRRGQSRRGD